MERQRLTDLAANYPYLQGLWALPLGLTIIVAGISNLDRRPDGFPLLMLIGSGLVVAAAASWLIARYYRETYGEVKPTRDRQVRNAVAVIAWIVVLFVGASKFLFWRLDSPICVYLAAFALATLTYYAILVGVRTHHLVIWGTLVVVSLLPIWGGLGVDRDPIAMMIAGVALMISGLFDQRLLGRALASPSPLTFGSPHAGR